MAVDKRAIPEHVLVKIRYLHSPAPARLIPLTDRSVHVIFEQKQRAITPGQSVVFYDNDVVLGGGVIAASPGIEDRIE